MTMPDERARALRFAGELLRELLTHPDVHESIKQEARSTLRHYPTPGDLKLMVSAVDHLSSSGRGIRWLKPEEPECAIVSCATISRN